MADLRITDKTAYDTIPSELKDATLEIVRGWYPNGRIDWEDVWDRLDGTELEDGRKVDIQTLVGPTIDGLKQYARFNR